MSTISRYSWVKVREEPGGTCAVNSPIPTWTAMAQEP